jgi:hypothetical protein
MTKPNEMLQRMSPEIYREAYNRSQTLSAFLEADEPSEGYNDGLDAFERLLMAANIRVSSVPEHGVWADTGHRFMDSPQTRALFLEYCARQWRKVTHGQRAMYTSQDAGAGTTLRPFTNADVRVDAMRSADIPTSELVAFTTPITGSLYRALYLTTSSADQLRLKRVTEGGEISKVKLTSSERDTTLYKFGRAIEMTYEQLRRMPIDRIAFHIQQMAVQAEVDKAGIIMDILIAGDGNAGTAPVAYTTTSLDAAATGGNITLMAWLLFKMKLKGAYSMTTVLAREANALKLMLLNAGNANIPLVNIAAASGFGSFTPINPALADGVRLGYLDDAPAAALVGFDKRYAIERVTEIGSDISETERYITRQTEVITLTENEGYSTIDPNATRVLTIA